MEINVDKSIVSKSIKHYGEGMQSVVCMEELSELSQAISKEIRGRGDRSNLVEEMADVIICLEILKQIFSIKCRNVLEIFGNFYYYLRSPNIEMNFQEA